MNLTETLNDECKFLMDFEQKGVLIGITAKHNTDFMLFPRRHIKGFGMSSFMVNCENILSELLLFFDGNVDYIFIDVEQKQKINLFKVSKKIIKHTKIISVKPNDTTLESLDLLVRNYFNDDLVDKNTLIIGTGNLASKSAIRLAERQANVFVRGRNKEKEEKVVDALNLFLPQYTNEIKSYKDFLNSNEVNVIISALSGPFIDEQILYPLLTNEMLIIDIGINNFSKEFIKKAIEKNADIVRLDTRIALPYQFLSSDEYVISFFNDVFGQSVLAQTPVVSGGYIGPEGSVIVDNISEPTQIIGVADGSGGVKVDGSLTQKERNRVQTIQQKISTNNKKNI